MRDFLSALHTACNPAQKKRTRVRGSALVLACPALPDGGGGRGLAVGSVWRGRRLDRARLTAAAISRHAGVVLRLGFALVAGRIVGAGGLAGGGGTRLRHRGCRRRRYHHGRRLLHHDFWSFGYNFAGVDLAAETSR